MDMEEPKDETKEIHPPLIDQLKEYAETRIKLAKYKAIDSSSTIVASIIADLVVAFSLVLAFIFASFTLAFYIATLFGNSLAMGFGCVTLIYLVIALVFKFNKRGFERPIANTIVRKFFR